MALTLEQHRMQRAYEGTRTGIAGANKNAWATVVMPFGTNVQRQGLLQALAFLSRTAKDGELNNARDSLMRSLEDHLVERGFLNRPGNGQSLIEAVAELNACHYMTVMREAIQISIWFKRAAQALCE